MRGLAVAFVGPDGAGKSTVTRQVVKRLGRPATRIYMGVNLEEANVALPTTRLLLAAKRRRGGRPDLLGWPSVSSPTEKRHSSLRDIARILNLIAEEWYRAAIAAYHERRGRIVVMDRHFIADYWKHDIDPAEPNGRPWPSRLHGYLLWRWYPRPDHIILLDASPELLHQRKAEASPEFLIIRRSEYVELGDAMGGFTTVSTEQPLEEVVQQCLEVINRAAAGHRA